MNRREFLQQAGIATAWAAISISIMSCSSDDDPAGPADADGVTGVVSQSGGHTHGGATVTDAQLNAGGAVNLTLTGAGHTHTVNLTAQQVTNIADGQQVIVQSSNDGHAHTVTFN